MRSVIVIAFIFYIWNPHYFERLLFLNELICAYGIIVFFKYKNYFFFDYVIRSAWPFLLVFIFVWVSSFFFQEDFYVYMRRMSIFYSFFSVFTVYDLMPTLLRSKLKWIWFFSVQKVNLTFGYMFLASTCSKNKLGFWGGSFFIIFVYTVVFGGSTAIFSIVLTYFIFNATRIAWNIVAFFIVFIFIGILAIDWSYKEAAYFTEIYEYIEMYDLLALDGNISVRLFMWWEIISEVLPSSYGLGIGFGTVLFNEDFIRFLGLRNQLLFDHRIEYTLSPHNSYMYILATMGLPGISTMLYMYYRLWSDYRIRLLYDISNEFERKAFAMFIAYSIAAGLNVVIESPIHSGLFWGILWVYVWARSCPISDEICQ